MIDEAGRFERSGFTRQCVKHVDTCVAKKGEVEGPLCRAPDGIVKVPVLEAQAVVAAKPLNAKPLFGSVEADRKPAVVISYVHVAYHTERPSSSARQMRSCGTIRSKRSAIRD